VYVPFARPVKPKFPDESVVVVALDAPLRVIATMSAPGPLTLPETVQP